MDNQDKDISLVDIHRKIVYISMTDSGRKREKEGEGRERQREREKERGCNLGGIL